MARHLLGVAVLTCIVAACSSTPLDPGSEQGSTEESVGSVNLPLITKTSDAIYRLNKAVFTITGANLAAARVVKPLPDVEIHNEKLPVGSYSISLAKGWVLEKKGPADQVFVAVTAQLVTPNPLTFDVDGFTPADALFGFVTSSGDVMLGDGSANIRIGVSDCESYDAHMAALGELTASCLGTIDPRAYSVSKDGIMSPNFASCENGDEALMRSIRQLLTLQHRSALLPFVKQCMVGRYNVALQKFQNSGIEVCPSWKKERVINPISSDVISKVENALPKLPTEDPAFPRGLMENLKENSIYKVGFETAPPGQKCTTPADCAVKCAAVFPGFVVGDPIGEQGVLTDPPAWQLETTYDTEFQDPYLRVNYYHPMSYYLGTPGVVFGEYARFDPCGGEVCDPEQCSYYDGMHRKTRLQKHCLDYSDIDTCVSYCGEPL
ncbi:MAG TPA: hypothetical protein VJN18_10910 [Polyangiaceae bacterium]|nr:hypothetical protein [Polyangiaceae bacterium]